ncbi:MAG: histone deacetylase [Anaerolineaceae bacterium]|nr:histone deacetylase [Anaerolineaceae bacterium]
MKVFYSDHFTVALPPGHRFPIKKYARLRQALLEEDVLSPAELFPSPLASRQQILRAHTADYYDAVAAGTLDTRIVRQTGLPWSPELFRRSLASVGGTLTAAYQALAAGFSGNLAGGTHHALAGEGMGYCVFNDLAVAVLDLLAADKLQRLAVIDLDVHQGNGTAAILNGRPEVFLLSLHGAKNYPYRRSPSTLDIDLPDCCGDEEYMDALEEGLEAVLAFDPQFVFYQAGVDPLNEDRLGRLSLSMEGLERRDRRVFEACHSRKIPLALVMGGGYAEPVELTVQAHVQTYRVAKQVYGAGG